MFCHFQSVHDKSLLLIQFSFIIIWKILIFQFQEPGCRKWVCILGFSTFVQFVNCTVVLQWGDAKIMHFQALFCRCIVCMVVKFHCFHTSGNFDKDATISWPKFLSLIIAIFILHLQFWNRYSYTYKYLIYCISN